MCAKILSSNRRQKRLKACLEKVLDDLSRRKGRARSFLDTGAWQLILVSAAATEFNPEIQRGIWHELRQRAVNELFRLGEFTSEKLLNCLKSEEHRYLSKRKRRYVLLTYLSVRSELLLGEKKISIASEGGTIKARLVFEQESPPRYLSAHSDLKDRYPIIPFKEPPTHRTACRVFVTARSSEEAYQIASRALDEIRGLWILFMTLEVVSFTTVPKPMSSIIRGPVETMHELRGNILDEEPNLWYFNDYPEYMGVSLPNRRVLRLKEFEKSVSAKLRTSKARRTVMSALSSLAKALDSTELDRVLLQLWSLLEWLCNKESDADYDRVIDRAVSFYRESQEREYHKSVLNGLRHHRNKLVHESVELGQVAGSARYGQENIIRFLVEYIDRILLFFIFQWSQKLSTRDSLCDLLDDYIFIEEFRNKYSDSDLLRHFFTEIEIEGGQPAFTLARGKTIA